MATYCRSSLWVVVIKRYAVGDTLREIIEDLNRRGLKTRTGKDFKYSSFNRILGNPVYIGEFHYRDIVIPGGVPAIVPQEVFKRVQIRRKKNRRTPAAAKAEDKYLLTTKLFCGKCGKMMVGESGTSRTGKTHHYYKCRDAKRKNGCNKRAVKKEWIEDLVVNETMAVVMNGPLMEGIIDRLSVLQGKETFDLQLLKKQLEGAEKGINNMLNAIQAGIITPSTQQRLMELEDQKEQLERQIAIEQIKHPILSRGQIACFIDSYKKTDIKDDAQRQRLIDRFVNSVYVFDDRIVLTFNYKDDTKTVPLGAVNGSDMVASRPPLNANPNEVGSDLKSYTPP